MHALVCRSSLQYLKQACRIWHAVTGGVMSRCGIRECLNADRQVGMWSANLPWSVHACVVHRLILHGRELGDNIAVLWCSSPYRLPCNQISPTSSSCSNSWSRSGFCHKVVPSTASVCMCVHACELLHTHAACMHHGMSPHVCTCTVSKSLCGWGLSQLIN